MSKNYYIKTYGCQMNENDSEKIAGILESLDYSKADSISNADIIIYNTCLIRKNAENKVYGNLGSLKSEKEKNPDLTIAVCGCMPQLEYVRETIKEKYKHVDIVFGTHNIYELPNLLKLHNKSEETIISVLDDSNDIVEDIAIKRKYRFKSFINIMHGCNNFCSYCIVPYTRGREKSREVNNIIDEIKKLANNGCKEFTLLGQNVNSYGKTLKNRISFANLLYKVNNIDGVKRIRFMTSHPKDLSDELIYAIRDCENVCEHIHLPLQSGSNQILKLMNRKYTREKYISIVNTIKREIPNASITTDIIVGFPNETEKDFVDTLEMVKKVGFDSAFTFLYSTRKGTPAAKMENQIPDDIKRNRFKRLLDTLYPINLEKNRELVNKTYKILVEGTSKNDNSMLTGRTRTNKLVHFKGDRELIGEIVDVKINEAKTWSLTGERK